MSRADTYRWHGEAMQVAAEAMKGGPDYEAIARARAEAQERLDREVELRSMMHGHIFQDSNLTCVCGMTKRKYMLTELHDRRVCPGKPYELLPEATP